MNWYAFRTNEIMRTKNERTEMEYKIIELQFKLFTLCMHIEESLTLNLLGGEDRMSTSQRQYFSRVCIALSCPSEHAPFS
jgi:hypothetical protein